MSRPLGDLTAVLAHLTVLQQEAHVPKLSRLLAAALFVGMIALIVGSLAEPDRKSMIKTQIRTANEHHLCYAPLVFGDAPQEHHLERIKMEAATYGWEVSEVDGKTVTIVDPNCPWTAN